MMRKALSRAVGLIDTVESYRMPVVNWALLLGSIIALRHFLEQLSGSIRTFHFISYFIHYPLAYVAPILGLSVVLALLSREKIERVTKLMLIAWCLTLLPPIVDLARPGITEIGYLFTESDGLGVAFLNLLNPTYSGFRGATLGIRVEAGLGCLLAAAYVYLKTRNAARALFTLPVIYTTMFFFFTLPTTVFSVARVLCFPGGDVFGMLFAEPGVHRGFAGVTAVVLSQLTLSIADLFVIAAFALVWLRLFDRGRFAGIARLVDPLRSGYGVLATLAGVALGARLIRGAPGPLGAANATDALAIAGLLAASFATTLAGGALSRIHESNDRTDACDRRVAGAFAGVCLAFGALFALAVSYVALTYVVVLAAAYYLCFGPPLHLGRFTAVRGLLLGAAALFSVELGFSAHAGANAALWMPRTLVVLWVLVPALAVVAARLRHAGPDDAVAGRSPGRRDRGVASLAAAAACLLPGIALGIPLLTASGAVLGILAALAAAGAARVPTAFASLGVALLVAAHLTGAPGSRRVQRDLAATDLREITSTSAGVADDRMDGARAALEDALACRESGDVAGEVEALERTILLDPENGVAHVRLGDLHMGAGRFAEAARVYEAALRGRDDVGQTRAQLAQAYYLAGDLPRAEEVLRQDAIERPESPSPHANLAGLLLESGRAEEARSELESAISLTSDPELRARLEARLRELDGPR